MELERALTLYTAYICKTTSEKLQSGNLLADAGRMLLKLDSKELNPDSGLQRSYLLQKIAGDLLRQAFDMGHFKQFDCSPLLKEYTYLAFELAYDYCEFKPDRRLLPFLAQVICDEEYKENPDRLKELNALFNLSLTLEKEYIEKFVLAEPPNVKYDIWGF